MNSWRTTLMNGKYNIEQIRRGIFQEDSLSPLWFALVLNPLSSMLASSESGYHEDMHTKISHLFYVNELQLYAKNSQQLTSSLEMVKAISDSLRMNLELGKCAVINTTGGKISEIQNKKFMDKITTFNSLSKNENYKYLDIQPRAIETTEL